LKNKHKKAERQAEAERLVARYRDPLLRTAFDLQSRLYNILRPNGFRGGQEPEYFEVNTLFVLADFLGWLEIIRRDMQFLDVGAVTATRELNKKIVHVQDCLSGTTTIKDPYYLYRGQQRAIGELMMVHLDSTDSMPGPRYETMGFAAFHTKLKTDGDFASWFERIRARLPSLPDTGSTRLFDLQHGLIDLIDTLDDQHLWITTNRDKLVHNRAAEPSAETVILSRCDDDRPTTTAPQGKTRHRA
jgi:hypothetical protein